jgi:RHS repeat-associated protein
MGSGPARTVAGDTTEYALDLLATLAVVISDTEAVYLYGLDIVAQQQTDRLYYMHDGLGSVRQLLDSTGEVQTNYAYDPFGVPLMGGEVSNPYQFTGEAWDAEVGLLYLRARYYQPEVGRFITKDPWLGDTWAPGSLNRYAYVDNNPPNLADPTGLDGGGPRGICPECKEEYHPITQPTQPEPEVPPYDEWVKSWPDPWIDEPVGWNWADEFEASQLKRDLVAQSKEVYGQKYRLLVGYALIPLNNPLREDELGLCAGSGPKLISLKNRLRPQWVIFVAELRMDTYRTTNYEPLWLDMLTEYHKEELEAAKSYAYEHWFVPLVSQIGTDGEEIGHFYDPGVGDY